MNVFFLLISSALAAAPTALHDSIYARDHAVDLMTQLQAAYGGLEDPGTLARFLTSFMSLFPPAFYRAAWNASADRWGALVGPLNQLTATAREYYDAEGRGDTRYWLQVREYETRALFEQLQTQ